MNRLIINLSIQTRKGYSAGNYRLNVQICHVDTLFNLDGVIQELRGA